MLDPALLDALAALAGPGGALRSAQDLEPYQTDFRRLYRGSTPLVLRPANVAAVSAIVALAFRERIALVPHGGNTGYCGGATPREGHDEVVLSLARLNRIRAVDPQGYTITVDAGCVLADVQAACRAANRLLALSLGSQGSCQIGGNLSTNAGGTSVLRYGMMRDQVLGLEVVLPDGRVLDQLRGLRKDNTGYDVKQLFLGAEGTLGIITGACLKLYALPRAELTALVGVKDLATAVRALGSLRDVFGDSVTGFEFMPRIAVELALKHVAGAQLPLSGAHPGYVLIEITEDGSGTGTERLAAALDALPGVAEATVAMNEDQRAAMWFLREHIPEGQRREGASLKHDVSIPVADLPAFVAEAGAALEHIAPGARLVAYGHVGDGNLHFNLSPAAGADGAALLALEAPIKRTVHDLVARYGGSFSAEHGIGRLKVGELERYEDPVALDLMRRLKAALDPAGIMNPGKVLR